MKLINFFKNINKEIKRLSVWIGTIDNRTNVTEGDALNYGHWIKFFGIGIVWGITNALSPNTSTEIALPITFEQLSAQITPYYGSNSGQANAHIVGISGNSVTVGRSGTSSNAQYNILVVGKVGGVVNNYLKAKLLRCFA